MQFEWAEEKSRINLEKHGISFDEAKEIFKHPILTWVDDRRAYGEKREIGVGVIGRDVVLVIVHTKRKDKIRLISARKANQKERELYYEYIQRKSKRD